MKKKYNRIPILSSMHRGYPSHMNDIIKNIGEYKSPPISESGKVYPLGCKSLEHFVQLLQPFLDDV